MGEGRVREILDEEEREQAVRGADRESSVKAVTTVGGVAVDLFGAGVGSVLNQIFWGFYDGRKKALFETRVNETFRALERRLAELGGGREPLVLPDGP